MFLKDNNKKKKYFSVEKLKNSALSVPMYLS